MQIYAYSLIFYIFTICSSVSVPPEWLNNEQMKANTITVLNSVTTSIPAGSFSSSTLFSVAFSHVPKLAYGITKYSGYNEAIMSNFNSIISHISTSGVSWRIDTFGGMLVFEISLRYLAVDLEFPYHFNIFPNLEMNFLDNREMHASNVMSSYVNIVDYKILSSSYNQPSKSFPLPFTKTKFLPFLNSLHLEPVPLFSSSIELLPSITAINQSHIKIQMDYGCDVKIKEIRYCIIVYDEEEIESKGIDRVYGYRYIINRVSTITSLMAFPIEVVGSFIVGLREFNDNTGVGKVLEFDVEIGAIPNSPLNFGMIIPYPTPRTPYIQLSQQAFSIFFIARYRCPTSYYFHSPSQMCEKCAVLLNCETCLNLTHCRICSPNYGVDSFGVCEELLCMEKNIGCLVCLDHYLCEKCNEDKGFISINEKCWKCPKGMKAKEGVCVFCEKKDACEESISLERYSLANEVMSYTLLIPSFFIFFLPKIIGLELTGVLQLCYFSLAPLQYIPYYLIPFRKLKFSNGYNMKMFKEENELPKVYEFLDIFSNFANNFNIMLIITLVVTIFGGIAKVFGQNFSEIHGKRIKLIGDRVLKEGVISLIIFNSFNVGFGLGNHFSLVKETDDFYAIGMFGCLICIMGFAGVVVVMVCLGGGYGEFKNKFKKNTVCQVYIPLTVVYRLILGFCLSSLLNESFRFLSLLFPLMFCLYLLSNLPFAKPIHNYRACFIHLNMFMILLVSNYYNPLTKPLPGWLKSEVDWPSFIEIGGVGLCVVVSIGVFCYEIFKIVIMWRKGRKIGDVNLEGERKGVKNLETEESMVAIVD